MNMGVIYLGIFSMMVCRGMSKAITCVVEGNSYPYSSSIVNIEADVQSFFVLWTNAGSQANCHFDCNTLREFNPVLTDCFGNSGGNINLYFTSTTILVLTLPYCNLGSAGIRPSSSHLMATATGGDTSILGDWCYPTTLINYGGSPTPIKGSVTCNYIYIYIYSSYLLIK